MGGLSDDSKPVDTHIEDLEVSAPHDAPEISIVQSARANPKIIMYSILLTLGPMAYGFDSIIVGVSTAIPAFLETYGEPLGERFVLPSMWLSLWNGLIQVGFVIGSVVTGPLADRIGRKLTYSLGALIAAAGIAVIFTSDRHASLEARRGAFLGGKTVLGTALGMMMTICLTYNSEISPTRLRGPLLSIFQFFLVLGQLIAAVVSISQVNIVGARSYRTGFGAQWSIAGAAFLAGFLIPESPAYLLRRNKVDAARKSFRRLYNKTDVEINIVAMQSLLDHEAALDSESRNATYLECFRGTNWRRTRIIIWASIVQQFLGVTFVANGTYFLVLAGMSAANSLMVLAIGTGLGLVANVCSWILFTYVGRRWTLIGSCIGLGLLWLTIGIAGCFQSNSTALWYMGVMINMILFFYGIGAGGTAPVVAAETSSIRLRAKSNAIGFIFNGFFSWAFNFFVPYMFNVGNANWGGKTAFFFTGLSLLAAVTLFFDLPELKNRTYREIDEMFEKRLPTRAFGRHIREEPEDNKTLEAHT